MWKAVMKNGQSIFANREQFNPDEFCELWLISPDRVAVLTEDSIHVQNIPIHLYFDIDGLRIDALSRTIRPSPFLQRTDMFHGTQLVKTTRPVAGCDLVQSIFHNGSRRAISLSIIMDEVVSIECDASNCSAIVEYNGHVKVIDNKSRIEIREGLLC